MHAKTINCITGIISAIVFLFFTWDTNFKYFDSLTRINYIFYDINFKVFHKKSKSNDIIIVDFDEKSLRYEGRWPWPRNKVAAIVKILQNDGAAVIGFDVLFPESELNVVNTLIDHAKLDKDAPTSIIEYLSQQLLTFNNDKIFAQALSQGDTVLGVFFSNDLYSSIGKLGEPILDTNAPDKLIVLHESKFIGNTPDLADAVNHTGFTTTLADEDGRLRRLPLLIEYNKKLYPSLSIEIAKTYLLTEKISLDLRDLGPNKIFLGIKLGDTYIPTDLFGNILINYIGPALSFPYISATDVLHKNFSPETFAGKIILIGSSAVGIG
ncbi:MAG: hypothetical protein ACD_20C00001G0003, partial [uncultured bacterium]